MSQLSDFLDTIWKRTDAYVYIPFRSRDGTFRRIFPKWPSRREEIFEFILAQTAQGNEVFFSPALWKDKPAPGEKFGKHLFLGSNVLWVDFDGNAPEVWTPAQGITPANGERSSAASTARPVGIPEWLPEPSIRVQSSTSNRQHAYWLLDEMITDVDQLENRTRTLALELNADSGGWDATQVLRPPDTTNYGYSRPERKGKSYPVFIEELSINRTYAIDRFKATKDFRPLVRESLKTIPTIRETLAKLQWTDELWEAFNSEAIEKKRSDQLMHVAYCAAEAGFTDEQIYAVIYDCDERWGKYKNRTDRERRLVDIVDRARAKHPVGLADLTFQGLTGATTVVEATSEEIPLKTLYRYDEFMATKIKLNWIFEGLLPERGYGIVAGPTGIGKSQLGIRLAEAVVSQSRFLVWPNRVKDRNLRVLLYSLEMSHPELQEFFNTMGPDFLKTGSENLWIAPIGNSVPLDTPDGRKFFENQLAEVQPNLVIIDSLSKSMNSNFKDDDPVLQYNRYINRIRVQYNTAVVNIHHNRKGQDKRFIYDDLDDLYGSRFLSQDAAFVLMLSKAKQLPHGININTAKVRFSASFGRLLVERDSHLSFEVREIESNDNDEFAFGELGGIFSEKEPRSGGKDSS
jgi:hypothetical protein